VSSSAGTKTSLAGLVRRTEGPQPWRRIFHAANGVLIAVALWSWPFDRTAALVSLGVAVSLLVALDVLRLALPELNRLFFLFFRLLASPREAGRIASSTWYLLGIALAFWLAPLHAALSGILVLALADPAASYFGTRWGRRAFLGGSIEGSLLFFGVSLAVLLPRHDWRTALGVAALVTLVERGSWPLDDNLTVPVACALGIWGVEAWL